MTRTKVLLAGSVIALFALIVAALISISTTQGAQVENAGRMSVHTHAATTGEQPAVQKAGAVAFSIAAPAAVVMPSIIYPNHPSYVYNKGFGVYQARCPADHSGASGNQQWYGPNRWGPGAFGRAERDRWNHVS